MDVGEKRKLKVAAGDKLLLQANWQKKFINGELVEVKAIQGDALVLADGRVIPKIIAPSPTATPSRPTPPKARRWMRF